VWRMMQAFVVKQTASANPGLHSMLLCCLQSP